MSYGIKRFDMLPEATEINDNDLLIVSQKGVVKSFKVSVLNAILENSFSGSIEEAKELKIQLTNLKNEIGADANALSNVLKQAEENLNALIALGDATALAEKAESNRITCEKNTNDINDLTKRVANNTTQLKESAQNITNLQNNKANLISTPQCTTKDITLYVSQNGNDSNDGLTEGTAVRTIQRAIDYIPKNVKHITKINVAKGNYDEIVVLVGFYGDGEIYITGDIDLSDGHIVKRIISRRNKVFIKFFGIKIQCNDETSVYSENDDRFILEKCIIDSPIQATNFAGVHSIASLVEVTSCTINNRNQAIVSRLGGCVMSTTNQGTNNICGLNADTGAIIAKNGSQPSGTTAEVVYAGGVIR